MIARQEDLRADGFLEILHQRQEAVGGRTGDDLDDAALLKFAKGRHEIAVPAFVPVVLALGQAGVIEAGELVKLGVVARAIEFAAGEGDGAIEIAP
ncbi:MAG: hypothetical protein WDN28_28410 [Chthoniobacter sp.]